MDLPGVAGSRPHLYGTSDDRHVLPGPATPLELQRQLQSVLLRHKLVVLAYLLTDELAGVLDVDVAEDDVLGGGRGPGDDVLFVELVKHDVRKADGDDLEA